MAPTGCSAALATDAAGEAFDKVGKLLGLGYPGGPVIDRIAPYGNPRAVHFTFAKMKGNALDFSFSGHKTAVLRWVEARQMEQEIAARRALLRQTPRPSIEQWLEVTPKETLDLLASFQHSVIHELLTRAASAAELIGARSLIISGGVACNAGLRIRGLRRQPALPRPLPDLRPVHRQRRYDRGRRLSQLRRGEFSSLEINAHANLPLA
jgi:N6-L-threonylcarbamoyladenine synthase